MNNSARREQLYGLLGELPPRHRPVTSRTLSTEQRDGYIVEHLELDLNGFEPVPAVFVRPAQILRPVPVILFNHSHGGFYQVGKNELLKSAPYMNPTSYASALTGQGYAALAIDHWCFGQRSTRTEGAFFRETLWKGQVMWGLMVYDSLRAIDYLATRPEVDMARLGTLGMSMGSTMAWWVAALDERVKVTVDICCLTDFHSLIESKGLELHGVYYYVPALLKHFDATAINALIAPRPHLALEGEKDALTPLAGMHKIDAQLRRIYGDLGASANWKLSLHPVPHQETPAMREEVLNFLRAHL